MGQDLKAWREVSLCDFDQLILAHELIYKSNDLGITNVWISEKGKIIFYRSVCRFGIVPARIHTGSLIQNGIYTGWH